MVSDTSPALAAIDLTVRYRGSSVPALNQVNMGVPRGTFYAVLGPNGSGKSTLLRALLGVVAPVSGHACVAGRRVMDWERRALAREVGVVPQSESVAFPLTVRDLVAMGRYPHLRGLQAETPDDRQAIATAMERCDVVAFANRLTSTLSGGEIQRARMARALAQEPNSLVLDEPTANLDIRHEMEILELLRTSVDNGMTVFFITHHLDLAARFADRILLLSEGEVVAEGEPSEVLDEETLNHVYQWPVSVAENPVTGTLHVTPLPTPTDPIPQKSTGSSRSDPSR